MMSRTSRVSVAFLLVWFLSCCSTHAQYRIAPERKIARLEKEVDDLRSKIKVLEARISALEVLRGSRSTEELRLAMIQSNRDVITNDINNLAANAYQFRIRPTTMGGGGGSYIGFTIPRRLASNDNADYEAVVSSDSVVVFTGKSKLKLGTVKAVLNKEGRLGSFEYTDEFQ